jgi:hypothetical protein
MTKYIGTYLESIFITRFIVNFDYNSLFAHWALSSHPTLLVSSTPLHLLGFLFATSSNRTSQSSGCHSSYSWGFGFESGLETGNSWLMFSLFYSLTLDKSRDRDSTHNCFFPHRFQFNIHSHRTIRRYIIRAAETSPLNKARINAVPRLWLTLLLIWFILFRSEREDDHVVKNAWFGGSVQGQLSLVLVVWT